MHETDKTVMVFGVFDHFHEGHAQFLKQAALLGARLIVAVAPDAAVKMARGKASDHTLEERIAVVQNEFREAEVVPGDETLGSWEVLKKYKPDVIAMGYDQKKLGDALRELDPAPEIVTLEPYKPETYHSRFARDVNGATRISGKIQRGKGEARTLGWPTINIPLTITHESGIFKGMAYMNGAKYLAALYIAETKDTIEAHLLDYEGDDLRGEWAVIEIGEKIRDAVPMESMEQMRKLIAKDIQCLRESSDTKAK